DDEWYGQNDARKPVMDDRFNDNNRRHTMKHFFRRSALAALVASSFLLGATAQAADYPSKAINIVVGYPAGGSVDLTGRVLGEALSERLGQSVVIENLGGAGGTIGANKVARAKADGYT